MRGTSQASLDAVAATFEPVLRDAGGQAAELGAQLFVVVDLLDGSGTLRRALSDPARDGDGKAALVADLLGRQADPRVVEVVSGLVRSRWSRESELAEGVEQLAADAVLAAAQNEGDLETVEEEVFRVIRLLAHQREVRRALGDDTAKPADRIALARSLFAGKVHPVTLQLLERAALVPRGRSLVGTLTQVQRLVARRRRKLVASVTSAAVLSAGQEARLQALLERAYERPVQLNSSVDPGVIGGLRIQIGPDVIDATVLARLDDVGRRLAG